MVAIAKQNVTLEVLSYHATASLEDAQRLRVRHQVLYWIFKNGLFRVGIVRGRLHALVRGGFLISSVYKKNCNVHVLCLKSNIFLHSASICHVVFYCLIISARFLEVHTA